MLIHSNFTYLKFNIFKKLKRPTSFRKVNKFTFLIALGSLQNNEIGSYLEILPNLVTIDVPHLWKKMLY